MAKIGHIVYAVLWALDGNIQTFRGVFPSLCQEHLVDLRTVKLDVLSESSLTAAIDTVMKAPEDRLDTLIHNAGHMAYGPAEAFTTQQFLNLYDINCVSTQRINKIALPLMRKGLLV